MAPRQCDQLLYQKKKNSFPLREQEIMRNGEILYDVTQKKWRLGKSIGLGAFGDVYLISDDISRPVPQDSPYVAKLEPHVSGPLFVEMNFYLRAATESTIEEWKEKRGFEALGIPHIYTFGSHIYKGTKMRFIITPRYGQSIQKMLVKHSNKFHIKTALTLASYVMDAIEYIHDQGYIHSDIKALNMVLGENPNHAPVYLIDFGLASKYRNKNGVHKEEIPDGRKADAGTMEFSSRDSHIGMISRRSDLESLGFNLVCWLGGKLPWIDCLLNSDLVYKLKGEAMLDIRSFLDKAFSKPSPYVLYEYLTYVSHLDYDTKPDYEYCRKLFRKAIRDAGYLDDNKLTFDSHAKITKKGLKRLAERENFTPLKKKLKTILMGTRKPCSVHNFNTVTRVTRNVDKGEMKFNEFDWASILAGNPEKPAVKKDKHQKTDTPNSKAVPDESDDLSNPTPAMLKVMSIRKQRSSDPPAKRLRSESFSATPINTTKSTDGHHNTPAMEEVIANRTRQVRVLRPRPAQPKHRFPTRCRYRYE